MIADLKNPQILACPNGKAGRYTGYWILVSGSGFESQDSSTFKVFPPLPDIRKK